MHIDTTVRLQVVESSSLISVLFREAFSYPYIPFFHLLVNAFCVISFCTVFDDPFPSLNWWAVSWVGRIIMNNRKQFTSKRKKGDVGMAKRFSNKTFGRTLDPSQ